MTTSEKVHKQPTIVELVLEEFKYNGNEITEYVVLILFLIDFGEEIL